MRELLRRYCEAWKWYCDIGKENEQRHPDLFVIDELFDRFDLTKHLLGVEAAPMARSGHGTGASQNLPAML